MAQYPPLPIDEQIEALDLLRDRLQTLDTPAEKIAFLREHPSVAAFLEAHPKIAALLEESEPETLYPILAILALEQGEVVFDRFDTLTNPKESIKALSNILNPVERFYDTIGGIVGYQHAVLELLAGMDLNNGTVHPEYQDPAFTDLTADGSLLDDAVRWGISSMKEIGEIYPLGGAGDRFNLIDELTGEPLPVAQLSFCGYSLLEGLIRDLQGREYLNYKLFGEKLTTPVAIMTSHEKDNHRRVMRLCEENGWFGRSKENFNFFIQPLVPMVSYDGLWAVKGPLQPILKPGGHGVMWKTASDAGVFDWFSSLKRKKVIVRQINNPVAGVDAGLLALAGIGCRHDKAFGFASCQRLVGSSEGMDVLRSIKREKGYECSITNIEYTEFAKCGIRDVPVEPGSPYSRFPSNTNILFGDLSAIREALETCTIPGIMINMKSRVTCQSPDGPVEKNAGRLESTMQNIADCILDTLPYKPSKKDCGSLRTFLTYNERLKTISVAKQKYVPGSSVSDTPVGCFYDVMLNYRDLLSNHCKTTLPEGRDVNAYLAEGPEFIASFHPCLGMLYPIIGQKVRGGRVAAGSEWIMEVAEADVENLDLSGSLLVVADTIVGEEDDAGVVVCDENRCGKCTLINVSVRNGGAAPFEAADAWRFNWERREALQITLHGNAEFIAENVVLEGDIHFEVPDGHRLVVYSQGDGIAWYMEKIPHATWKWDYTMGKDGRISLEKIKMAR